MHDHRDWSLELFSCSASVKFAPKHFLIFLERQGTTKMLSYFTVAVFIFNSSQSLSKKNSRTLDLIALTLRLKDSAQITLTGRLHTVMM